MRMVVRFLTGAAVLVCFAASAPRAQAQDVAGDWRGTLKAGAVELRLVLHVSKPDGDRLAATLDSIDQGANGIPVSAIAVADRKLTFSVAAVQGSYEGRISDDGKTIEGTWVQQGQRLPLVLEPIEKGAVALRRPQVPVKPYPYREEDVTYTNKSAGVALAGTLTIPEGPGPFPAIVLITGSGPQDRDESLMGHRPFLVLADYLTRKRVAVLRADDRGVGKSGGVFSTATTADFAGDVEAGVEYLKTRAEVDPRKIGLVGHSEGGIIAPMVAARNRSIAFIVLMAGSGVPGDQILVSQSVLIAQASGASREAAEKNGATLREVLALVKSEKDPAVLETRVRERLASTLPPAQIEPQIRALTAPWLRFFVAYDPATALARVTCPVLAIAGDKDLQVPSKENLAAIRAALQKGGNQKVELEELPGLNHLFQTAKTGLPSEYGQIEETMAPVALDRMARWILSR